MEREDHAQSESNITEHSAVPLVTYLGVGCRSFGYHRLSNIEDLNGSLWTVVSRPCTEWEGVWWVISHLPRSHIELHDNLSLS